MPTYNTEVEINECETAITIHYIRVPFSGGSTDGRYGPKIEPDEPAHLEIDWIEANGKPIELTSAQEERILEEIADHEEDYDS